jgi:hypothetical protein
MVCKIAHGSFTKAVCLPNRGWWPLLRAMWVVRSDWPELKPHGSYVCTVGCTQIERQSSSLWSPHAVAVGICFICTKCLVNAKKWLEYSKGAPKCTRKSNLGYNSDCILWKKFEPKRWSRQQLEFELPCLLLETMILLVRCSGFQGAIIQTCAKLYQKISTGSWEHAMVTHRFSWFSDSICISCN